MLRSAGIALLLSLAVATADGNPAAAAAVPTVAPGPGTTQLTEQPVLLPSLDACKVCSCLADKLTLNCTKKKLENHFPDPRTWTSLGFNVTEAIFDYNVLVHVLPWAQVDSLKKLSMRHNKIVKIDNLAFLNLTNIEEIDLSYNEITSEVLSPHIFQGHYAPDKYEPLQKLRVLRLSFNALHTIHQDLFEHLPGLEEVYLDANPFKVIDRNTLIAITSIPYLKVLDLSRTGISALPDHMLHTPKYLQHLNLAGNQFTAPPPQLIDSHGLQHLDLSENPFVSIDSFPLLRNLTSLTICHSPTLRNVSRGALSSLPALSELRLHNNKHLSLLDPIALATPEVPPAEGHVWPPIKLLHLHDNGLEYLESMLVGRWDQVTDLRLEGNPWSCDCDNQWLIETLMPVMEKRNPDFGLALLCASPPEMLGKHLRQLQGKHTHMRCKDLYGNQPERDASLLIAALVGVLVAVPLTVGLFLLWRRLPQIAGILRPRRGAGDYSRAFYQKTSTGEPDDI